MTDQYAYRIRRTDSDEYDHVTLSEDTAALAVNTPSMFDVSIISWDDDQIDDGTRRVLQLNLQRIKTEAGGHESNDEPMEPAIYRRTVRCLEELES